MRWNLALSFGGSALLFASHLFGSSVSASCIVHSSPPEVVVNSGETSANCLLQQMPNATYLNAGTVYAMSQIVFQLADNSSQWNILNTAQSTFAGPGLGNPPLSLFGPGTMAVTAIDYQNALTTAGPLRAGYLQWQGFGSVDQQETSIKITTGIIQLAPYFLLAELTCSFTCTPGPGYFKAYPRIPFLLGAPFTLEAMGSNNAMSSSDLAAGGLLTTNYQFRFFEADGFTPVAVSEVPEPSSLALLSGTGIGILFTVSLHQRRRN